MIPVCTKCGQESKKGEMVFPAYEVRGDGKVPRPGGMSGQWVSTFMHVECPPNDEVTVVYQDEDCCGGYPGSAEHPGECLNCGCREAGNASFLCGQHYDKVRQEERNQKKRSQDNFGEVRYR